MTYLDGSIMAVPIGNKQAFTDHARLLAAAFLRRGALRVVDTWADSITPGTLTDFARAVQAEPDEAVAFTWVLWPDKPTRVRAFTAMMDPANIEPATDPAHNPTPFDGKRMIFGGFEAVFTQGDDTTLPYIQGFVTPALTAQRDAYVAIAQEGWTMLSGMGALGVLEAWADDVPHGSVTDFYRAVDARDDESVVFSYVVWPSQQACDEAAAQMEAMEMPADMEMPFDPGRMVYAGFTPILDMKADV